MAGYQYQAPRHPMIVVPDVPPGVDDAIDAAYDEQHKARKKNPPRRGPLKPCGTTAAYQRHLRAKEKACQPCLDAESEAGRQKRAA